jgi:hypothetical protein
MEKKHEESTKSEERANRREDSLKKRRIKMLQEKGLQRMR